MASRELTLTDDEALAVQGLRLAGTHVTVPPIVRGWAASRNRADVQLEMVARLANNLRVYRVEDDAAPGTLLGDRLGVAPGRFALDGADYVYAGSALAVAAGLSADGVYSVWAEDDGLGAAHIAVSAADGGWPSGAHVKLATVTKASGVLAEPVDFRGAEVFSKPGLSQAAAVADLADTSTATTQQIGDTVNALLASLRAAGLLAA